MFLCLAISDALAELDLYRVSSINALDVGQWISPELFNQFNVARVTNGKLILAEKFALHLIEAFRYELDLRDACDIVTLIVKGIKNLLEFDSADINGPRVVLNNLTIEKLDKDQVGFIGVLGLRRELKARVTSCGIVGLETINVRIALYDYNHFVEAVRVWVLNIQGVLVDLTDFELDCLVRVWHTAKVGHMIDCGRCDQDTEVGLLEEVSVVNKSIDDSHLEVASLAT